MENIKDEHIKKIVRAAAKESVHETLISLGFDMKNVTDIQSDMRYIRKLRLGTEMARSRIFLTIITTSVPAFMYIFWESIKTTLKGN